MIQVEGLTKYYGPHPAVTDVSFSIAEGEIVAFLGPNGAGKTTTMRVLTGYLPPTFGTVKVAGYDVVENSLEVRRNIGYMPEHIALYPEMRVRHYLSYCGRLQGLRGKALREAVDRVISTCGLEERADSIVGTLSLGYRQRVGLAQALIHDPPVLILDEPTIGLDPNQIREVRSLIKSLGGHHTIMLSTHILPEAQMTCERVIIINRGRIVAEDTPDALAAQIRRAETIFVRARGDINALAKRILDISGVTAVRPGDESGTLYVDSEVGADVRADVAKLVVQQGADLLELRPVEMSLEEVFRELTMEEPSPT
ncbi:MAG: ATP-binding cassette domain-containing protein [Armatimonadetes bacterium]|nr:ATP-binding cassette domain-containing protein [Armatimonadota bacterium]